jgi:hypothetical protein
VNYLPKGIYIDQTIGLNITMMKNVVQLFSRGMRKELTNQREDGLKACRLTCFVCSKVEHIIISAPDDGQDSS